MRKFYVALTVALSGLVAFAAGAGAEPAPIVDAEAEATSLFTQYAPIVVAVVLAVAGFSITMAVLSSAIRRVRGALQS